MPAHNSPCRVRGDSPERGRVAYRRLGFRAEKDVMKQRATELAAWMLAGMVLSMSGSAILSEALAPPNKPAGPAESAIFASVAVLSWTLVPLCLRLFREDDRPVGSQARLAPLAIFFATWLPVGMVLWVASQILAAAGMLAPDPLRPRPALFLAAIQPWFPILTTAVCWLWMVFLEPQLRRLLASNQA